MDAVAKRIGQSLGCLERVGEPDLASALAHVDDILLAHLTVLSPDSEALLKRAREVLMSCQETDPVDAMVEKLIRLLRGAAPADIPTIAETGPTDASAKMQEELAESVPMADKVVTSSSEDCIRVSLTAADPDTLRDFVTEARQYVSSAEAALLKLETTPTDAAALRAVFRAFHTPERRLCILGNGPDY